VKAKLFHPDTDELLKAVELRAAAREEVETSPLIRRASQGDRSAATALHRGFWPFVSEFEIAIDQHTLPRLPLRERFGSATANSTFLALVSEVRKMKEEEGSHAAHWRKDAELLGIDRLKSPLLPSIKELVGEAYSEDHTRFFSVLAGTEFIAEELSAFLVSSVSFTELFERKRWVWGEVHLIPHDDGPSHLEIDLDLARAYQPEGCDPDQILQMVLDTIRLFGRCAEEVEREFCSGLVAN
jgi:hypothetical protein